MVFTLQIVDKNDIIIKTIEVESSQVLLDAFKKAKIIIDHTCDGNATCGTCRIFLVNGKLSPREAEELEFYHDRKMNENERLSCQSKPLSNLTIKLP